MYTLLLPCQTENKEKSISLYKTQFSRLNEYKIYPTHIFDSVKLLLNKISVSFDKGLIARKKVWYILYIKQLIISWYFRGGIRGCCDIIKRADSNNHKTLHPVSCRAYVFYAPTLYLNRGMWPFLLASQVLTFVAGTPGIITFVSRIIPRTYRRICIGTLYKAQAALLSHRQ